jgi:methionyl-tRNA synthetase
MTHKKYYYITTPIYYVNDAPHIGSAYTSLVADTLARFMRLDGREVKFLTGTDEHGQKIDKTAASQGMSTREFVDRVSEKFRNLTKILHLTNDDFIRTTEPRHIRAAQALWQRVAERGFIYEGKYTGWYCVRDEAFYAEKELIDGKAPTGAEVEWVEESSYFFALSKFQDRLLAFYHEEPDFIGPTSRRNEIIRFVEAGLHDLSVSRTTFQWGVPVPGDEKHVMYVWMDALTNYLTALGFPDQENEDLKNFWPEVVHLVGKDILRFHAVYWPAFLMAADLKPPKRVFAHGWWTVEGQKISKSMGNAIDPIPLIQEFGLDQLRYFMLAEKPIGGDGDFSRAAFIQRINADLANDFGNLVQRVLSFIQKNAGGMIPEPQELSFDDQIMLKKAQNLPEILRQDAEQQAVHKMCEHLWQVIGEANRYVDVQAPWVLKKTDPARMNTVLYVLVEVIRHLAVLASPIVPLASEKMMDQLRLTAAERTIAALDQPIEVGRILPVPQGVFPRIVE